MTPPWLKRKRQTDTHQYIKKKNINPITDWHWINQKLGVIAGAPKEWVDPTSHVTSIYTTHTCAAGMLLHSNGKFILGSWNHLAFCRV